MKNVNKYTIYDVARWNFKSPDVEVSGAALEPLLSGASPVCSDNHYSCGPDEREAEQNGYGGDIREGWRRGSKDRFCLQQRQRLGDEHLDEGWGVSLQGWLKGQLNRSAVPE